MLESGHVCHLHYLLFQGDLLVSFRACSGGATVSETTQSGPQHYIVSVGQEFGNILGGGLCHMVSRKFAVKL